MAQDRRVVIFTITIEVDGTYTVNSRSRQSLNQDPIDEVAKKIDSFIKENISLNDLLPIDVQKSGMSTRMLH